MDTETINAIKTILEEFANKNSGTVTAAYITIGGMFFVSLVGVISQWLITKRIVSEERKRISLQVNSERYARQHEKWETEIIESITGLLKATDPEINPTINPATVTGFVLRAQLLLNTKDPNQDRVNHFVNQLALAANRWKEVGGPAELLKVHDQLLQATKLLIYQPRNHA